MVSSVKQEYMRKYWANNKNKKRKYAKDDWEKNRLRYLATRKAKYAASPKIQEDCRRRSREWRLKNLFGITTEQYNEKLMEQNYSCAICKKHNNWRIEGRKHYNLAIDHSHKTGKIRGLLCNKCNLSLGWFESFQPTILTYLERADAAL